MANSTAFGSRPCLPRQRALGGAGVGFMIAAATVGGTATTAQAEDYVVQPGDTVSHIALRTSASVPQIVAANGLDSRATIRIGQTLTIPEAAAAVPQATSASHVVVRGDTVWALARAHGTSVDAIVAANGLDSRATIRIGQTLTIPGGTTATVAAPRAPAGAPAKPAANHKVVRGDTVSALARTHGTSVAAIVAANGLDSRATILIGRTLTIPGSGSVTTSGSTASGTTSGLVGDTFAGRTYPAPTVAAANQNKATLLAMSVPSKADMRALVAQVARDMGVDPALAQAVAYQESGFNHASVSPANAIGTMQVIPTSGQWASEIVGRQLDLLDPRDNVVAGVAILGRLIATSPDLPSAIAGYYQGQRSVRVNGMFSDTRRYVASVQTLMARYA